MAGQKIEAPEALSWGLIDRIALPESLLAEVRALTEDSLAASANHVAGIKALIPT
jgi:enoyl-CoA hydratase/carnithine racemase